MNWLEFKNIFEDAELVGDKIVVKSNLAQTVEFIKNNYHFELLIEIVAVDNKDDGIELIFDFGSYRCLAFNRSWNSLG